MIRDYLTGRANMTRDSDGSRKDLRLRGFILMLVLYNIAHLIYEAWLFSLFNHTLYNIGWRQWYTTKSRRARLFAFLCVVPMFLVATSAVELFLHHRRRLSPIWITVSALLGCIGLSASVGLQDHCPGGYDWSGWCPFAFGGYDGLSWIPRHLDPAHYGRNVDASLWLSVGGLVLYVVYLIAGAWTWYNNRLDVAANLEKFERRLTYSPDTSSKRDVKMLYSRPLKYVIPSFIGLLIIWDIVVLSLGIDASHAVPYQMDRGFWRFWITHWHIKQLKIRMFFLLCAAPLIASILSLVELALRWRRKLRPVYIILSASTCFLAFAFSITLQSICLWSEWQPGYCPIAFNNYPPERWAPKAWKIWHCPWYVVPALALYSIHFAVGVVAWFHDRRARRQQDYEAAKVYAYYDKDEEPTPRSSLPSNVRQSRVTDETLSNEHHSSSASSSNVRQSSGSEYSQSDGIQSAPTRSPPAYQSPQGSIHSSEIEKPPPCY